MASFMFHTMTAPIALLKLGFLKQDLFGGELTAKTSISLECMNWSTGHDRYSGSSIPQPLQGYMYKHM